MPHRKILTIGNSFSNNALTYLRDIAAGSDDTFTIGRASLGGCSLEKHWNLSRYTAAHPEFVTYPNGNALADDPREGNLQDLLRARAWDIVTLQQNSAQSWKPETFQPWLGQLMALVHELAPGAEIVLHQTWAYRSDAKSLIDWGIDDLEMHRRIDATYAELSRTLGLRILPSGPALFLARSQSGRHYIRDPEYPFAAPVPPLLPRQEHNFSVGYHWGFTDTPNGIPELRLDANHLNMRGHYLTSATWYETLTGRDVRSTAFCPAGMDEADRRFLAEMAHQTVAGRSQTARK